MNVQERDNIVSEVKHKMWNDFWGGVFFFIAVIIAILIIRSIYLDIVSTGNKESYSNGKLEGLNEGYNQCMSDMIAPSKKAPKG